LVTSQDSEALNHAAAESWNPAAYFLDYKNKPIFSSTE